MILEDPSSRTGSPRGIEAQQIAADVVAIVPTYNRANLIAETLTCLLAQRLRPGRILVVDDGSSDETSEIVRAFQGVDYVRKDNGGKAAALNLALQRTSEPLIWIFDDDDLAPPEALELLVDAMQTHAVDVVYGDYINFLDDPQSGNRIWRPSCAPSVSSAELFPALLERCFIFQGAMLVRRQCYELVGGFDESLIRSQDYEMLLRLTRRFPAERVDAVLFHQRQHQGLRGSSDKPVDARRVDRAARDYDQRFFTRLAVQLPAREYLPRGAAEWNVAARRQAFLQKACVFARVDLWDVAGDAFADFAGELASSPHPKLTRTESAILERTFDLWSRGLISFKRNRYAEVLRSIKPWRLRVEVTASLIGPLPYWLRTAILRKSLDQFRESARALIVLAGPAALGLCALQRLRGKLARLVQGRSRRDMRITRSPLTTTSKA